ncbi:hypothetical protein ACWDUI_28470 [Streptosporangium sandarakinum]|uniref:hypothetical protein n=1 Tax=Streptosporangium TaxID=2000 RepID=UPI0031F8CF02
MPKKTTIALLVVPVFALAACGSGGQEPTGGEILSAGSPSAASATTKPAAKEGKGAFYDAQLAYVRCMRQNGLQDWPDPKLSGHPDWDRIQDIQRELQKGSNLRAGQEKLTKAMRACMDLMNVADALAPKQDPAKLYEALLKHAKCMRDNGVSAFANPKKEGNAVIPGGDPNPANPAFDIESPAYERARQACKDLLPDGSDQ